MCPKCQLSAKKVANKSPPSLYPVPPVAQPFERWGIDFVQHLPLTADGNRHILTSIDYATRWVEARAVEHMDARTVANFLHENILMRYGAPFEIFSDRGKPFLAEGIKEFEVRNGIKHIASTPYHPQTNGMVEKMYSILGKGIATLADSYPERWDMFLQQTLFAIRIRKHAVTGYGPVYLLYGVGPRLMSDTNPPKFDILIDELEEFPLKTSVSFGFIWGLLDPPNELLRSAIDSASVPTTSSYNEKCSLISPNELFNWLRSTSCCCIALIAG